MMSKKVNNKDLESKVNQLQERVEDLEALTSTVQLEAEVDVEVPKGLFRGMFSSDKFDVVNETITLDDIPFSLLKVLCDPNKKDKLAKTVESHIASKLDDYDIDGDVSVTFVNIELRYDKTDALNDRQINMLADYESYLNRVLGGVTFDFEDSFDEE